MQPVPKVLQVKVGILEVSSSGAAVGKKPYLLSNAVRARVCG